MSTQQHPAAWAVFADNGNVRLWSTDHAEVRAFAERIGQPLIALNPGPPAQPAPHDDPIGNACRLLRAAAQECAEGVSVNGVPDWKNEPDTHSAYIEHITAAHRLEQWAASIGAGGVEPLRRRECLQQIAEPAAGNWINAADVDRLVRELDVALNGDEGAAPQASLCDVVGQAKAEAAKLGRPLLAAPAAVAEVENLRKALQFYADGEHFIRADQDAWDTVSGEPPNYWCDEAGTATVEDGSIAKLALSGQVLRFEDDDAIAPREQAPAQATPSVADKQLADALDSLAFYRRRCELLQSWQSKMRDPERTIVCDILANGQILRGPDGQPDACRYAQAVPAAVAGPSETVKFVDESTADPVEKARRYLKAMGDQRMNSAYFFDDGYPRREISQGALATLAVLEQLAAAPTTQAAPREQNAVPAEWLEQAYREGWAACRDAETIGEEAEDWAFGNSTANSRMIDAQQAAPQQEAQEPHGWLYDWTHSSATGKPDTTITSFTADEVHARKHDNCRAIYTAPQPAPVAQGDAEDAARLDWLLLRISGAEFRRIGVCYSGNARRADVDAARSQAKEGASHG